MRIKRTFLFVSAILIAFTACEQNEDMQLNATFNGHAYVDLGLPSGTLWATCNVGAENPWDGGDWFAWGETKPKTDQNGNYRTAYSWSTYKWANSSYHKLLKYCNDGSFGNNRYTDTLTVLEPADDAATVTWGGDWRMPTLDELSELCNECKWVFVNDYENSGKSGYKVCSKASGNSNFIFMPISGYREGSRLYKEGIDAYYWSSMINEIFPNTAYYIHLDTISPMLGNTDRFYGYSVRPVCSAATDE